MSGQIPESKVNEVRERSDIIELVSQYVDLKRSGANHMGLCPFHSEKSPSLSVHAGRQFYHCFGCGVGGDVFSFLMQIEGLAFPDAVRRLAERAGIELEERQLSPEEERRQQQRERLYRVNELATEYFHRLLMEEPAGEACRQYLKRRGYGRKAAGEYQIGYAADTWEGLVKYLQEQGVSQEDARMLGLIRPRESDGSCYDLFRGRLMFPIFDLQGRPVAFGGRVLDDSKPKYINSPESPIYHKGRVLFGLYQARQSMRQRGEVILVEGYFDQLALYRAGFPQVVATCGTALTADHARLLKRYVQKAILLFDQDEAGKQATFKAMAALQEEGVPALVVELPRGDDPDSFVQAQGPDAFRQRLEQARPVMDLFMEDALQSAGLGVEQKVRAAETVIERIAELSSSMEQDLYLKELAGRSGIELELLKQQLAEVQNRPKSKPVGDEYPVPPEPAGFGSGVEAAADPRIVSPEEEPFFQLAPADIKLLKVLIFEQAARAKVLAEGVEDFFFDPNACQLAHALLTQLLDVAEGEELQVLASSPELLARLPQPLEYDPAEYADLGEDWLESYRRKTADKRMRLKIKSRS
jgi:DNA primase